MLLKSITNGERYPELVSAGVAPRILINASGLVLLYEMEGITPDEIRLFESGNRLDITADRIDDLLIMTFYFGGKERDSHGCCVTYTPHLGYTSRLPKPAKGQGYLVHMLLVDEDGTILAQRMVELSTKMSLAIRKIFNNIASKPFNEDALERTLRKIYDYYCYSPDDLRHKARHKYTTCG